MESSPDRRKAMENELKNTPLNWEIFPAFDGRKMDTQQKDKIYDSITAKKVLRRDMSNGEIGCAVSHRSVYAKMIADNVPEAIVLEDDVFIDKDFVNVVENISRLCLQNSIVKLEDRCENLTASVWGKIELGDKRHELKRSASHDCFGAYGYYLDLIAAKTLIRLNKKVFTVADHWVYFSKFLKVYFCNPCVVRINQGLNKDSSIWEYDITAEYINSRRKYPRGINFIVRNMKKINLDWFRKFFLFF